MTQYKEVKRKANVGERIKVVNTHDSRYKNGDEFVVERTDALGVFVKHPRGRNNGCAAVLNLEYVVLEPIEAANLPELLTQFLRENAAAVRKFLDEEAPQPKPLTRADVIAKAKADVADLRAKMASDKINSDGNHTFRYRHTEPEFHVNREKRAVTALVRGKGSGNLFEKATAKCAPGDVFHAEIGKAIALRKALGLTVPVEYTNAPKPDKPRVGVVVDTYPGGGDWTATLTRRYPTHDGNLGRAWNHTHDYGWLGENQFTVIDDTDVDYGAAGAEVAA